MITKLNFTTHISSVAKKDILPKTDKPIMFKLSRKASYEQPMYLQPLQNEEDNHNHGKKHKVKKIISKASILTAQITGLAILDKQIRKKTYAKKSQDNHERCNGGVAADIDEVFHGGAAASSQADKHANGLGAIDAVAPLMIGLGILGQNAGLAGMAEAKEDINNLHENIILTTERKKHLSSLMHKLQQELIKLQQDTVHNPENIALQQHIISNKNIISTIEEIATQDILSSKDSIKILKYMQVFARASWLAGNGISFKFSATLIIHFLATIGVKSAAFTAASTGFSFAATAILTPVITSLAAVIGGAAWAQAYNRLKKLKPQHINIKNKFAAKFKKGFISQDINQEIEKLAKFITNKAKLREWFYRTGKVLLGSFTILAVAFTAVAITAAIIGASANPVTAPIMAIIGAGMLIGGSYFLFGHAKGENYYEESQDVKNDELLCLYKFSHILSEKFDAGAAQDPEQLELIIKQLTNLDKAPEIDIALRLNSWEGLFTQLQNISATIAAEKNKKFTPIQHIDADDSKIGTKHAIQRNYKNLGANFSKNMLNKGYRIMHLTQKQDKSIKQEQAKYYAKSKYHDVFNKDSIENNEIITHLEKNPKILHKALLNFLNDQQKIIRHKQDNFAAPINNVLSLNNEYTMNLSSVDIDAKEGGILVEAYQDLSANISLTTHQKELLAINLKKYECDECSDNITMVQELFAKYLSLDKTKDSIAKNLITYLPARYKQERNNAYNTMLALHM